jgi:serine/threonine-protein kinase
MFTTYILYYLVFVIAISLVVSLLVLWLKLPSPRLVVGLIMLFIASPLIVGYFYLMYFNSLPEVIAPDVTGLPLAEAKASLEALGLRAREAGSVYEAKMPEGRIVSQRPEGGRRVKAGRVINLMVSGGKKKVTTPNLVGRPLTQADEVIYAAELQLGEIRFEQNLTLPEGTIMAQEPLAGEEAGMGERVSLLVATTAEVITEEVTEEAE